MSTVPNAQIKVLFTVRFKTTGVPIAAGDLVNPDLAAKVLPVLAGTESVDFIDGVLRVNFHPEDWFYQPQQIPHIVQREIKTWLKAVLKPYVLSNNAFGFDVLDIQHSVLEPEQQWPDNLARL